MLSKISSIENVGIGPDHQTSGKYMPDDLNTLNSIEPLKRSLRKSGYSEEDISKIMSENLIKFLALENNKKK